MEDFPKYYKILFNAMTDAIKELESCNYGYAAAHLKRGQVESEAAFLADTDGYEDPVLRELAKRALAPVDDDPCGDEDPYGDEDYRGYNRFEDNELPYI